jgi:hypothetical protein
LTLGVVALVGAAWLLGSSTPVGLEQAFKDAAAAEARLSQASGQWKAMAAAPPSYPFPAAQIRATPTGWQPVTGLRDRTAVAYRLGPGATVFVFRPRGALNGWLTGPPLNPKNPGGSGVNFGAWAVNGLVYVLRIEGSAHEYQRALLRTSPPLALLQRPQILRDRYHG